jgi:hypothetical protein
LDGGVGKVSEELGEEEVEEEEEEEEEATGQAREMLMVLPSC